jgi:mRNA interferase MazF
MEKPFHKWSLIKQSIHSRSKRPFYHEREIWWCSMGVNIGFEQDGKGRNFTRPILIMKGFSKQVLLCVPLTTQLKQGKYYHDIFLDDNISRQVILSQIKLIDSKRLLEKITKIDERQFLDIKKAIIRMIE